MKTRNIIALAVLALLTSCEKEPIEDVIVDDETSINEEVETEEEEETEDEEASDAILFTDVQARLDTGELPIAIWRSGIPLKTLYNRKTYKGGYICYLDTVNGGGLIADIGRIGTVHFNTAIAYAEELSIMSKDSMEYYTDWRIPTYWELLHLAKQRRVMISGYSNSNFYFFSSTKLGGSVYRVFSISFADADVKQDHISIDFRWAKAVRSFNNYIEL